jgi:hypothetical protein
MAGFEGYTVGTTTTLGVVNPVFISVPDGFVGYAVGNSTLSAGGTIIETPNGFKGYTVEQVIVPKVIITGFLN